MAHNPARNPARTPARMPARTPQRGAALLLSMVIVALVTSVAAAMVWHQHRALQTEGAERARTQASWILLAAMDWARLILREDLRNNLSRAQPYDSLDEPWAAPLEETPLSSFLAADQNNTVGSEFEAMVSGRIEDAQSRFNLRQLLDDSGAPRPDALRTLQRLCTMAGLGADCASRVVQALARTLATANTGSNVTPNPGTAASAAGGGLAAQRLADLAWQGLDTRQLAALRRWVDLLPTPTPVNANTAPAEVLAAAVDKLDLGSAQRLVVARQRRPFESLDQLKALLPAGARLDPAQLSVASTHFMVTTRLRLEDRVLQEQSLLVRREGRVEVLRRDRRSLVPLASRAP